MVRHGGATIFRSKKIFFHVKSENKIFVKFLHVNNAWDFSLSIEQDISDKKEITFSEFIVLAVNWAITITNNKFVSFYFCKNEQKFNLRLFLIKARTTEAKTKSKIYHVLGDTNQLVLNCKRFSYFQPFTRDTITLNTTHVMYLYRLHYKKYVTWEGGGKRQQKVT